MSGHMEERQKDRMLWPYIKHMALFGSEMLTATVEHSAPGFCMKGTHIGCSLVSE